MNHDGDASEIQADIQRTRGELDRTLSAIEQRLAPGQLVEDGIDYLRHNGATEYVVNLGEAAKRDPIPLALVGVGIAWLMMSSGRNRDRVDLDVDGDARSGIRSAADDVGSAVGDIASTVKDKVAQTSQKLSETAQAARDRAHQVGDAARSGVDRVRDGYGYARERAGQVGDAARQGVERVRGGYDYLVHEQPLALGAIGLAIGAVLGAAAPRTRQEDRLMGETSDRLTDELKRAGREQLEKAKDVATAAEEAVRDSLGSEASAAKSASAGARAQGAPSAERSATTHPSSSP